MAARAWPRRSVRCARWAMRSGNSSTGISAASRLIPGADSRQGLRCGHSLEVWRSSRRRSCMP
jgi:hypothetical protein